uniref:TCTP domain-containing protein n=1 Tax=Araucaria cunninghamii TaxID=56994 RepID=A0A0D6QXH0_ARACU
MIIYKDSLTGDEIISDTYNLTESPGVPGLWEVDCRNVTVGSEDFVLEGANASAEGDDAGDGVDAATEQKLDIVRDFRLNSIPRPDKKVGTKELKKYAKAVLENLKASGKADQAKEFQDTAADAVKKILGSWDTLDIYTGESMTDPCMWVFVDYREDGVTPYALVWKHALEAMKV